MLLPHTNPRIPEIDRYIIDFQSNLKTSLNWLVIIIIKKSNIVTENIEIAVPDDGSLLITPALAILFPIANSIPAPIAKRIDSSIKYMHYFYN